MQNQLVNLEMRDSCAIITIDNPPLNVTSQIVRLQLLASLKEANKKAQKIIITGEGKAFVAGADAKEFDQSPIEPHLPDVIKYIEEIEIPTIAAINGIALGGGLEITLACHYRIANPNAKLGLPEVNLGLIPGAGGTQRLPRLVGLVKAIELITEGKTISAQEGLSIGLIDHIADDVVDFAMKMETLPKLREKNLNVTKENSNIFEISRQKLEKKIKGQIAPFKALDLIEFAAHNDLEIGLKKEREVFLDIKNTSEARALRHIFFAERGAGQFKSGKPKDIFNAIVVGGGNMGASIAYALVQVGIGVTIVESDENAQIRAQNNISSLYAQGVKRGKITQNIADLEIDKMFNFKSNFENLPKVNLVIEAIFEDLNEKQKLFEKLDKICDKDTIFATNTSYLNVNKIFEKIENQNRTLGLHFFAPAHIMKLLEIVRTENTSDDTLASAFLLAKRLGKIAVEAGVCDGFIGNRILTRYRQNMDILLLEGAMPWQIDEAMREFGFAMGPYEVQDLSGLEIAYANRARLGIKTNPNYRYISIADLMVEKLGRLGRKNAKGWYDYLPDSKPNNPYEVEKLILECSQTAGIIRKKFTNFEIQNRALLAIIDEAIKILDEGIAQKPSDIDLVMVHGYAFPRWHGGPMQYAVEIGFKNILDQIIELQNQDPKSWSVCNLLRDLATNKVTINQLNQKALS